MVEKQAKEERVRKLAETEPVGGKGVVQPGPPKSVWREYFESAVVTVIMFLFGITCVAQTMEVPTGSMQNTILIGDHMLVNKFIFAPGPTLPLLPQREIRRGDIIVFKYPGNRANPRQDEQAKLTPYKTYYVKRVIGLPGETIEARGARVFINGRPLPERLVTAVDHRDKAPVEILSEPGPKGDGPYTVYYDPQTRAARNEGEGLLDYPSFQNGAPVTVPSDSYFVMGDNRSNSADGRVWGFVKRDLIVGRPVFVYWSYDESKPSSGFFIIDFFKNTRWGRTGTIVK